MFKIELDVDKETENRLRKMIELSSDPETFAARLISFQISELRRGITNLRVDIKRYEDKYRLSTTEFYKQYQEGSIGDRSDYMVWAGLYEMLRRNEQQLLELE